MADTNLCGGKGTAFFGHMQIYLQFFSESPKNQGRYAIIIFRHAPSPTGWVPSEIVRGVGQKSKNTE